MTAGVVVDSCVAIKWFVLEPASAEARLLLSSGLSLVAPDLILLEIANALWKNEKLGRIEARTVDKALNAAASYFDSLIGSGPLMPEAAALARAIDHAVYDCLYVVAARRTGFQLVTTDRKLLASLAGTPDARIVTDLASWGP